MTDPENTAIVCLCVLNEEAAIGRMIELIQTEGLELVVTDGGSTDKSVSIAEEKGVAVLHRPGKGKGFGMKQAMQYAKEQGKEWIVFIDCDLTYPVERIKDLLSHTDRAAMVIGARDRKKMSPKSRFLNTVLSWIMAFSFGRYVTDTASGFRAMKLDAFLGKLQGQGMVLELEITGMAIKKGYIIHELEVDYYDRVGESKLVFYDLIDTLKTIIKTRFKRYN